MTRLRIQIRIQMINVSNLPLHCRHVVADEGRLNRPVERMVQAVQAVQAVEVVQAVQAVLVGPIETNHTVLRLVYQGWFLERHWIGAAPMFASIVSMGITMDFTRSTGRRY
jgi:hypothetical protein